MIVKKQSSGEDWEYTIFTMEPSDVEQALKSDGFDRVEQLDAIARPWRRESWFDTDSGTSIEYEYETPENVRKLALEKCDKFVAEVLNRAAAAVQWQAPIKFQWSKQDKNALLGRWRRLAYDAVKETFYWLDALCNLPKDAAYKNERARAYAELRDCLSDLG